ncbi:MAG: hypothetical protein K2M79_03220 [Muribaculaceae bacterium]|nr:hypothetical protein [Muribaculaceae bacterium]
MNKLFIPFLFIVSLLVTSCSNDDEPKSVNADGIAGEWYLTNIRGWEYDEDAPKGKYEFNETFNYNSQGIPVGNNIYDAHKVLFTLSEEDIDKGIVYLRLTSYEWNHYADRWQPEDSGVVKFDGKQFIDGTMKVTVTKLTEDTMVTYQKDSDGETYITYTRL